MERLTNFLFALVLTAALTSCIYDFGNNTGASGAVLSNNGKDNKITSLSALIDQTPEDGTINLSEYADITDYSASINKAVTINAGNIDMNDCSLSINESGVILNGLNNANVSANPGIGNGSLKISGSSLNSLNIFGGGLNSIHLLNNTEIKGKTVISKEYNTDQENQPVRLVMDNTVTITELTIKSSAVLDSGTSEVNNDNLKSVIFDIDETSAETSVNVAVSANLTFTTSQQTSLARVQFQSSTVSDARMDIFVMKKNETVTINKDFFTDAFQRLIGDVTKDEIETEFSAYIGHSITESDISSPISVDNLIEPVTVTLYYYNGDEAENFTFAKGKKLDISAQGKTKDGYVFRGWSTDIGAEEADPELTAGEFVTVNEDKTFYFVWKKDETTATTIP
ncbi:MAG: InlB B-repeat-containing protein, partial [Spirochaetales bacterium]|nr:InlB B-repeat-containing protein [Spirochaetales bacterium]